MKYQNISTNGSKLMLCTINFLYGNMCKYYHVCAIQIFKKKKSMVLVSQRQSNVFSLLTRPESIVSHIGFHLADGVIASTGWNPLLYWKRKFNSVYNSLSYSKHAIIYLTLATFVNTMWNFIYLFIYLFIYYSITWFLTIWLLKTQISFPVDML